MTEQHSEGSAKAPVDEKSTKEAKKELTELQKSFEKLKGLANDFGKVLTQAFVKVAVHGKKLKDVLRSLVMQISQSALKIAMKPLEEAVGGAFEGLIGGLLPTGAVGSAIPKLFAKGGVISSPTAFAFGGGNLGIAGERGPEAIMPLARGSDGRLGVRSGGGNALSISFNVSSPDAKSFLRSESQIAAMLNRVVDQGRRNL